MHAFPGDVSNVIPACTILMPLQEKHIFRGPFLLQTILQTSIQSFQGLLSFYKAVHLYSVNTSAIKITLIMNQINTGIILAADQL